MRHSRRKSIVNAPDLQYLTRGMARRQWGMYKCDIISRQENGAKQRECPARWIQSEEHGDLGETEEETCVENDFLPLGV